MASIEQAIKPFDFYDCVMGLASILTGEKVVGPGIVNIDMKAMNEQKRLLRKAIKTIVLNAADRNNQQDLKVYIKNMKETDYYYLVMLYDSFFDAVLSAEQRKQTLNEKHYQSLFVMAIAINLLGLATEHHVPSFEDLSKSEMLGAVEKLMIKSLDEIPALTAKIRQWEKLSILGG